MSKTRTCDVCAQNRPGLFICDTCVGEDQAAARDSTLEEAARVADEHLDRRPLGERTGLEAGAAIRRLKSTPRRLYSVEEVERALRVTYPVVRDGAVPGWWPDFRAALEGKAP